MKELAKKTLKKLDILETKLDSVKENLPPDLPLSAEMFKMLNSYFFNEEGD